MKIEVSRPTFAVLCSSVENSVTVCLMILSKLKISENAIANYVCAKWFMKKV